MKMFPVGEFKRQFSDILEMVRTGNLVGVSYGKKGKLVAVLAPPKLLKNENLKFGLLKRKASFKTSPDFKMTDGELFSS